MLIELAAVHHIGYKILAIHGWKNGSSHTMFLQQISISIHYCEVNERDNFL